MTKIDEIGNPQKCGASAVEYSSPKHTEKAF